MLIAVKFCPLLVMELMKDSSTIIAMAKFIYTQP